MTSRMINRRTFAATMSAVPILAFGRLAAAQTPIAESTESQVAAFAEQRDALLQAGRALVEAFLAGNNAEFQALADNPDFAAVDAAEQVVWLETNRVRLRWPETGVVIDVQFDGTTSMTGLFYQGGQMPVQLEAEAEQLTQVPSGRWNGVVGPGTLDLEIAIAFDVENDSLTATLDIPSQGVSGFPFPQVSFHADQPIGIRVQDEALPLGPANLMYAAEYEWGDALLTLNAVANPDGGFLALQPGLRDPLPPDPTGGESSDLRYRLPADGELLVVWGGPTEFQNYHAIAPMQRHALDLVAWENGATYRTDGLTNEDYVIWGRDMLAPAAGTVVAVESGFPDIPPAIAAQGSSGTLAATPVASPADTHPAGNHVVIQVGDSEFVFLAHMQRGSITVAVGDTVAPGDPVGLIGNSGNTSESHIHIHAQSVADLFDPSALGIPLTFVDFVVNGEPVAEGRLLQGEMIQAEG